MRAIALCALVAAVASAPFDLELAEEVQAAQANAVSCKANTYYWGFWQQSHYCVKCKDGLVSSGCTNCKADPKATACHAAFSCTPGTYISTATHKCEKCAPGQFQPASDATSCRSCTVLGLRPRALLARARLSAVAASAQKPAP